LHRRQHRQTSALWASSPPRGGSRFDALPFDGAVNGGAADTEELSDLEGAVLAACTRDRVSFLTAVGPGLLATQAPPGLGDLHAFASAEPDKVADSEPDQARPDGRRLPYVVHRAVPQGPPRGATKRRPLRRRPSTSGASTATTSVGEVTVRFDRGVLVGPTSLVALDESAFAALLIRTVAASSFTSPTLGTSASPQRIPLPTTVMTRGR
jgi:hypothetical protein